MSPEDTSLNENQTPEIESSENQQANPQSLQQDIPDTASNKSFTGPSERELLQQLIELQKQNQNLQVRQHTESLGGLVSYIVLFVIGSLSYVVAFFVSFTAIILGGDLGLINLLISPLIVIAAVMSIVAIAGRRRRAYPLIYTTLGLFMAHSLFTGIHSIISAMNTPTTSWGFNTMGWVLPWALAGITISAIITGTLAIILAKNSRFREILVK
ncbi:hypothetical protein FWD07_00230 [Candidatus Saccharibacteria bacterium]|nr:hypothetical protein [Candidatus Saccharibacteria bacterium]